MMVASIQYEIKLHNKYNISYEKSIGCKIEGD